MKRIMTLVTGLTVLTLVQVAFGATVRPVSQNEAMGVAGATHVVELTYADLAESTNVNTSLTITNLLPVVAKTRVEFVGLKLLTAFDTGTANDTNSVGLVVGDGTDTDLYLTTTDLASDDTEVWLKFAALNSATISTSVTLARANVMSALTTNFATTLVSVVTNVYVTATATAGQLGSKVYTAGDTVDFVFTPSSTEALADNTSGDVLLYFRLLTH